jgi:hypothetical protein
VTVVVGVDGAGRTHRLGAIAAAAGVPVTTVDSADDGGNLAERLAAARDSGHLVVVDDADRLPDAVLAQLAAAARQGTAMAIARRPSLDRPALAALDEVVAAGGAVETLAPLDDDGVAAVLAAVTGRPSSPEVVGPVRAASAGLPALVAMLAAAPSGSPPPALLARMQQRLARLPAATATLARTLSLELDLPDEVLAAVAGLEAGALATAMRHLHDRGMLVPGGERMIPAVAQAVLADLPPAGRRSLHDCVVPSPSLGPLAGACTRR